MEITFNRVENSFFVIITDTGIGIDENYLPEIFKPFSQEEEGTNRTYEGNGLGLALANEYCKLNGFQIDIISQKHSGSKVKIKLS